VILARRAEAPVDKCNGRAKNCDRWFKMAAYPDSCREPYVATIRQDQAWRLFAQRRLL
jgi:hypothetical protein